MIDIEAIKARLAAAEPGPWRWAYAYQCRGTHWCLENDASAARGLTINHQLVTFSTEEYEYDDDGEPTRLDQTPDFQLIAHAPADIAALLAALDAARAVVDAARAAVAGTMKRSDLGDVLAAYDKVVKELL